MAESIIGGLSLLMLILFWASFERGMDDSGERTGSYLTLTHDVLSRESS